MEEDKSWPRPFVVPSADAVQRAIAADADRPLDENDDEDESTIVDDEKAEDAYVEELAEDLDGLYTRAGRVGRGALKTSTGTVVSQLLTLRLIDAVEALGEKLDAMSATLDSIDLALATQEDRARELAAALQAQSQRPAGG